MDLLTGKLLEHKWSEAPRGTVLVFLSSVCPCSNSHVAHLSELSQAFPEIKFIGIHSNADESKETAESYFRKLNLPFPVIQDNQSEWAERLKAYRTPHSYLISPVGDITYQGGVTSSADPKRADSLYLKVTLKKYLAGEKIEGSRTRVLGCQIARK